MKLFSGSNDLIGFLGIVTIFLRTYANDWQENKLQGGLIVRPN